MGIFSDLKRVLFGAKSVTKHAAEKAGDEVTEKKNEFMEKTEEILEDLNQEFNQKTESVKTTAEEVGGKVKEEAKELWDKTKQKSAEIVEDIKESPAYKKTTETIEKVGDTVLDTGEKFYEKTKEVLEGPGKEMADMAKEISEDMGEKIVETSKTIYKKTKEVADNIGEKFDKTFQKAQEEAELEKNTPKSEFADTPIDTGESTLKDADGFFEKAEKYAEGTYSDKPEILDEKIEPEEKVADKKIPGFEDKDNDGDDLIDDAEVVDENK